jgi:hypothetical protein
LFFLPCQQVSLKKRVTNFLSKSVAPFVVERGGGICLAGQRLGALALKFFVPLTQSVEKFFRGFQVRLLIRHQLVQRSESCGSGRTLSGTNKAIVILRLVFTERKGYNVWN